MNELSYQAEMFQCCPTFLSSVHLLGLFFTSFEGQADFIFMLLDTGHPILGNLNTSVYVQYFLLINQSLSQKK